MYDYHHFNRPDLLEDHFKEKVKEKYLNGL